MQLLGGPQPLYLCRNQFVLAGCGIVEDPYLLHSDMHSYLKSELASFGLHGCKHGFAHGCKSLACLPGITCTEINVYVAVGLYTCSSGSAQ
jgi:hypothetical protein